MSDSTSSTAFRRKLSKLELVGIGLLILILGVVLVHRELETVRELRERKDSMASVVVNKAAGGEDAYAVEDVAPLPNAREKFDEIVENYTVVAGWTMDQYWQKLEALQYDRVLEPSRLVDRSLDAATSVQMKQALELAEDYESRAMRVFEQTLIDFGALDTDEDLKEELRAGLRETLDGQRSLLSSWWEAEVEHMRVTEEVTLLAARGTGWLGWESSIVIPLKEEASAYDIAINRLDELAALQAELAEELVEYSKQRRDQGSPGIF